MNIKKRHGGLESYNIDKIRNVIMLAFDSVKQKHNPELINIIAKRVEEEIKIKELPDGVISVEQIQDQVEIVLTELNHYEVLKSFILYRNERSKRRQARQYLMNMFEDLPELDKILKALQKEYDSDLYSLYMISAKFMAFNKSGMSRADRLAMLIKASVELTTREAPKWEFIAARLRMLQFNMELENNMRYQGISKLYDKIKWLSDEGLYGKYILQNYSKDDIEQAEKFIVNDRNYLLNYSGLDLLLNRYVIHSFNNQALESPQEMFLGIALHLAMNEKQNRLNWVKRFYDMLSTMQVTMATPTLSNARKPYHQLSSCFIDTVPDDLDGIYRSIDNFSKVSKFGGGMGLYFGKVRASGSDIRGFKGAAGGVIRWIKLANDTAVAVDQLGVRQGAVAVYLDVWHRDIPEFLALRTNNGDDRMKAHDVFPAVCYPNLFWQTARDNIESDWYLMCPHEISKIKGYKLEDTYGKDWEEKYKDCVADHRIAKRIIPIKELVRLIIKSAVETGTPFVFNRDHVNEMNPNKHKGMIYCSNLCTEIAQNMGEITRLSQTIEIVGGEEVVVTVTKPGQFVVCNLASLSLGRIDTSNDEQLAYVTESAIRALDNVIDLNYFPVPYAKINNMQYRPIGLGVSGYHHMLAKHGIMWESDEHLNFVDDVFERINYHAIKASCTIADEKGSYRYFEGSDWQTGEYFEKRNYTSENWQILKNDIAQKGLRNAYIMAIAPTSSTSIISGTTAGLDPIMNRYFLEEKKNGVLPRVAPELSADTMWYYKSAHTIDQSWSVRASGIRSRHIDQAMSMNLYITNDYTFRAVLNLYVLAWEKGVKTIYYIRSKSLEIEECDACSS